MTSKQNKMYIAGMTLLSLVAGCGGGNEDTNTNKAPQSLASVVIGAPDYGPIVQQLYISYFGRPADPTGLNNFKSQLAALGGPTDIQQLDQAYKSNAGIRTLVDSFGVSDESAALYSGDNVEFVTGIYKNVLNRAPDNEGLAFWVEALNSNSLTRANASLSIMAGGLVNTSTQGRLDADLINNKITVGGNFTDALLHAPVNGYDGNVAAGKARAMLSSLSATTDIQAFQSTVGALVSALAESTSTPATPIAATCASSNFTTEKYKAIALNMTLAQVNQVMGCEDYVGMRSNYGNGVLRYSWIDSSGAVLRMITVTFDESSNLVKEQYPGYPYKMSSGF